MGTVIDIFTRRPVVANRSTASGPGLRQLRGRTGHLVEAHHVADLDAIGEVPTGGPPLERFRAAGRAASRTGREPDVAGLVVLGWVDPGGGHPRLWAFGRTDAGGPSEVLYLDDSGRAHVTRVDRRYRRGYRWEAVGPLDACWMLRIPVRPLEPSAC